MVHRLALRLKDKVAIITGAAGGIGAASARLFAQEGARVVLADIADEAGRAVEREIGDAGGKASFVHCDVTSEDSVKRTVDAAVASYGRLDILFNIAGGSDKNDGPVHEVDLGLWEPTLSVNLLGTVLCCRHAIPQIIEGGGGSVINTSSWAGLKGFRKHLYVSAKGGLLSLTRAMAGEYARAGVRVNVVCPGGIRSERNLARYKDASPDNDPRFETRKRNAEDYPFSYGDPIDVAYIGLFLASDESRLITGATIPADGGRSAY
jgi:NAD(P)-dependent dehydrogenase (short-subunit alcohol dehydrogenase family)